ncbi:MAG TPA: hypothetical protein VL523_09610 [Terriglobia bacterium]|nr:hypothetical protein [Terriglobia bacterium]
MAGCALILLLSGWALGPAAPNCAAQDPPAGSVAQTSAGSSNEEKGFTFYEFYGGSFNSFGHVTKLDTTVGYNFNRTFGIDAGIPFYFVGVSNTLENPGPRSVNGVGDAYVDLLFTVPNPTLNYLGTLRGTAPTGDTNAGFSTGRATFDWDNYFDHNFGRLRPFLDAGFANTISDTHFFYRPFTTLGLVAHFEGGASYKVVPALRVGASLYDDAPIGQQKIFSRLIPLNGAQSGSALGASSSALPAGVSEIVGPSSIARDNGFSAWVTVQPTSAVAFEAGYDRSVHYATNTFSFGIGVNVGALYRKARRAY